jgi:hypothetical protein
MGASNTKRSVRHFSAHASLAAIGVLLRQHDVFGPIRERVRIAQKTVKHTPLDKLYDGFITLLMGAHGLVEINTRLRSDRALQRAVGRIACAEQSVVQQTLDACTEDNVGQMQHALDEIYRRQGQGYRHDYAHYWQVLDADISGLPCGKKAACASKGYFAKQRNRRGRQVGRVLASRYDEIVVDRLFSGTTQLATALPDLVTAAERTLELDADKRARTIIRLDAGGGTVEDVNWLLRRGYAVHGKDYSGQRARALAASVTEWVDDPRVPGRQVGWVTQETTAYVRPVRRIAVRTRKKNGQWGVGVLLSVLTPHDVITLTQQPIDRVSDPTAVLLAYVYFYDQRGGGVETAFKEDKQGLGLTKRSKKRFAAQQMVLALSTLAHNVLVWARAWLVPYVPALARYGLLRLVRDVLHVSGTVLLDPTTGRVRRLVLNAAAPLAAGLVTALRVLLAPAQVAVTLGET